MELVEYLLFLASSIGFWFGFSVFTSLFQARALMCSFFDHVIIEDNQWHYQQEFRSRKTEQCIKKKDLEIVISTILSKISRNDPNIAIIKKKR